MMMPPSPTTVHDYWLKLEDEFETYETPFIVALMRSFLYIPLRDAQDSCSFHTLREEDGTEVLVMFSCRENFDAFFSQPDLSPAYAVHRGAELFRSPPVRGEGDGEEGRIESCVIAIDPNLDPVVELPARAWEQLKERAWEIHNLDARETENWVEMKNHADNTEMRAVLAQLDLPPDVLVYYFVCLQRDVASGFVTRKTDMFWVDVDDDREKTQRFIASVEDRLSALLGRKTSINNLHDSENALFGASLKAQHLPLWPPRV